MIHRLEAWWLTPVSADRLAVVRICVGSLLLSTVLQRWGEVAGLDEDPMARFAPVGVLRLLSEPLPSAAVGAVQVSAIVLGILWTLGLAWRFVAPLCAAAFLVWATYGLSWGAISHDLHLLTLHVLVLALTPAACALSLDARRKGAPPAWTVAWSIRLLGLVTVLTYFLAGWSKIWTPAGFDWARGQNLLDQVAYAELVSAVYTPELEPSGAMSFLREHPWMLSAGATLTLVVELGAPLALLHRRLGYAWALGVFAMHLGILLVMRIRFPYPTYGLAFLSFLPVERLRR